MPKRGVLLHLSSLPGDYGIGDAGFYAYAFIDWLSSQGYSYWQILPLNPCAYGNSPYNPISTFALNPLFISPEELHREGLIKSSELEAAMLPRSSKIDYASLTGIRESLLQKASLRYLEQHTFHPDSFDPELKPYLAFTSLMHSYGHTRWFDWEPRHRHYSEELFWEQYISSPDLIRQKAVEQILADEQLNRLKAYAASRGIGIIGDMPLYIAYESAELWAYQKYFKLNPDGTAIKLAGVPPDAFSEDGQLWGNPVYDWDALAQDGFSFFTRRIDRSLKYIDILRLDHFIGYVNYWEIDASESTAKEGVWVEARAEEFFTKLLAERSVEHFIAEDLGILNEKVCAIRDSFGFDGMIVLQFCFDERVPEVSAFPPSRIIYSGTHDNKTSRQWFEELEPDSITRSHFAAYTAADPDLMHKGSPNADNAADFMVQIAFSSPCRLAIVPLQDILNLGAEARMNIPGTALGNWEWRLKEPFPGA